MTPDALHDAAARATACDPTYSCIVEAAAGSGKTALLTQRFLALLARVAAPEEIVAITFTRKAAAEMRARVLKAFALAAAPPAGDEPARTLQMLARAAVARDADAGWRLRENPARLRIMTIDALTGALVRRLPLQSGLVPGSALGEDPRELYRLAARRTLLIAEDEDEDGEWRRAVRAVLADHDNDWRRLEERIVDLLARRDQWLDAVVGTPSRDALDAARRQLIERDFTSMVRECPALLHERLVELARWIGQSVAMRDPAAPEADLATFAGLPGEVARWCCLAQAVLKQDGGIYRRIPKALEPGRESDLAAFRAAWRALAEALDAAPGWHARFAALRRLPALRYGDREYVRLGHLLTLLRLAVAQWRLVSAEVGTIDFTEQALAAVTALGSDEAPSDLALALDYRLAHLLIDEFQDTSRSQYALLERLVAGWTGADGRTLFLVGDPMQSIYRFRDADVNLFQATLAARRFAQVPLAALRLTANFRTCPRVLGWLNDSLARTFAQADRALPTFHPFQATREDDVLAEVAVHAVSADAVAARAIGIIERTWARAPEATIAILVRSRAHLGTLPRALASAGIPLATNDIDALGAIPCVNDLAALTRALADPADRTAWFAVLRAPWCGLPLVCLREVAGDARDGLVWTRIAEPTCGAGWPAAERARLARVRTVFGHAFAARGRQSHARLVESTWHALGGPATLGDPAELRHVHRFLALVAALETADEPLTGPRLASRIAEEFAPFPRQDGRAVEVMTVHRAKGLEFDVVLLPELQRAVQREPHSLLQGHAVAGVPPLFATPPPVGADGDAGDDALYEFLRDAAKASLADEGYRLLYVALTRARRALHLFCAPPEPGRVPRRDSFLGMLWPALADAVIATAPAPDAAAAPVTRHAARRVVEQALPPPAQLPRHPVQRVPVPFEWASPLAKPIGTVTHAFLQAMAEGGAFALPTSAAMQARLRALGLRGREIIQAEREVARALAATRDSPRGRWLFDPTHREARSEYRITALREGRVTDVIVDRTFVTAAGVRWIVDFKTSAHEGGDLAAFMASEVERYRPQLEAYARVFAALSPQPIMLGLYYPRLDAWREWPAPG
ncbi:MAG: UvrD-helicase domain-containing protein [Gammaproteobacteria bacterium]